MPYIRSGKCVYKKKKDGSLGKKVGCSSSKEKAKKYLKKLYSVEEGKIIKITHRQLRKIIKEELHVLVESGKKVGAADSRDHAYEEMKKALRDTIRVDGLGTIGDLHARLEAFRGYYSEDAYAQAARRTLRNMTRPISGTDGPRRMAQDFAWLGFDSCDSAKKFANVSNDGEKIIIKKTVQFVTGKADIKPESLELLAAVACIMNNPGNQWIGRGMGNLRVEGHTDNVGDEGMNMRLSQERAESVAAALVQAGLSASRVTSVGLGETKPVADNSSASGRKQNRRVEFHLERN